MVPVIKVRIMRGKEEVKNHRKDDALTLHMSHLGDVVQESVGM